MDRLTQEKQIGPFAALIDRAEAVPGAFGTYDCLYAHMVAVTRLKQYEDTGLTPEEIIAAEDRRHNCKIECLLRDYNKAWAQLRKFRDLYIEVLKKHADDPCAKCKNNPGTTCGKNCPSYIEGRGGTINGKYVDCAWSCQDFDWGDCPRLEGTICHGCFNNGFASFELKELDSDA